MNTQKLTEEQKDIIVENHLDTTKNRMTQEDVGYMFRVSARTVYRALVERGCITPKAPKAKVMNTVASAKPVLQVPAHVQAYMNQTSIRDVMTILRVRRQSKAQSPTQSA